MNLAKATLAALLLNLEWTNAFTINAHSGTILRPTSASATTTSSTSLAALLSMDLEKPLGIILEEVEENAAQGVKVEELSDAGSAYASPYKDQLVGLKVAKVMDVDVTAMVFDDVMDCIINAPTPVNIAFEVEGAEEEESAAAAAAVPEVSFDIGTAVTIKVIQEGNADKEINAKVGDNLRKTLLDNKVELYRGLKKKLGNCGGGGQCTFCAVDMVETEGWQARSDYENGRIKKFPTARLACLNNIQGPATIRVQ
jgi:ferredoxin